MSAAWEGYEPRRRGRRRGRQWRGRFAAAAGVLILAAGGFGIERGCTQGIFGGPPTVRTVAFGGDADPAAFAVVVYNEADPLSRDLADFYAGKRGIDHERVVGLKCPITEEISREEYDSTIAGPLRAIFDARQWWTRSRDRPGSEPTSTVESNRIRFLVLMRGVPLKIRGTANYPGDFCNQPSPIKDQNAACVDSELAVLGLFTHSISGLVPNATFRTFVRFTEPMPPGLMFTGRLDAPTGTMVRRMIDDSLAVEKTGLWGRCYVDGRGIAPGSSPLAEGDEWMKKIATDSAPRALPTVYDNLPTLFSTAFPMNEAAMYFGWYNEQPVGPFTRDDFHFRPGAVACHLHSFSATSVRDPSRWWVAPLLNRGADAVLGNVYEPYLSLTTHLDVFADRLADGYTLAESAWEATPAFSWMNTVVGDPLYRPGKVWKDLESDLNASGSGLASGETAVATEGRAYWQAAQTWFAQGPEKGAAAMERSGNQLRSGRIFEGLAGLETTARNVPRAVAAYEKAARFYQEPSDGVRVAVDEMRLLEQSGQQARAAEVLAAARKRFAGRPSSAALEESAAEISAVPR